MSLSELAAAGAELIHSIDINPFIRLPHGGKAVDAVIVTRGGRRTKKESLNSPQTSLTESQA